MRISYAVFCLKKKIKTIRYLKIQLKNSEKQLKNHKKESNYSCPAAGRMSRLVSVPDLNVLTDQLPNSSLVAIDSRGNVYSASADARQDGVKSTLYRKAAGQAQFVPVATNVHALRALAVGPDDAVYLKSGHAVIRLDFARQP